MKNAYEKISHWWVQHPLYDPAHEFQLEAVFEESYCILGGLKRLEFLGALDADSKADLISDRSNNGGSLEDALVRQDMIIGENVDEEAARLKAGIAAFSDRVRTHQGVQGPPEALFMGYGLHVLNGTVAHACVADHASSANAVLDTVRLMPNHPHANDWLECIERWAGWVLKEFRSPDGAIGVGVFCHEWNPIPAYWCATSLFSASLLRLATQTGKAVYADAGRKGLDWLATFDYTQSTIPNFSTSSNGVLLYLGEGLAEGLRFIAENDGLEAARLHPIARKAEEVTQWLIKHQDASGAWPAPATRGHRSYELGLPWLLLRMERILGPKPEWRDCAERFLNYLVSEEGEAFFGLYVRPWAMGLAQISLGERLIR